MDALTFLKGLPAVLGVVGFFAYLWAGQSRVGSELFKSIVDKLRASPNVTIENYAALTPARITRLIETDARVRAAVNEQDQKLLRLIIILQNVVTVVVLVVCAVLVGFGIWLISRPEPLAVTAQPPHAVAQAADGLLVDLDPLKVEWWATGVREPVAVFLENVDSKSRSPKKTVTSDVRSVTFEPEDVRQVATTRGYRRKNRIRAVVEWSSNTAQSEVVELLVGIRVQLMLGGKLITPQGTQTVNTLMATIDDSTEFMPENYCFQTDLVGWTKSSPFVGMLKSCNQVRHVDVPGLADIDWGRHVGLVYDAPDDRRIVRTCISGQPPPAVDDCG